MIEDQTFDSLAVFHRGSPLHRYLIQNLDLHRCSFANCNLHPQDLETRTLIQNVRMFNCRSTDKFTIIGAPILDEVLIENFRCGSIFLAFGAAFRHVTLRGHMPNANFNEVSRKNVSIPIELLGNDLNREFYEQIVWALDISEANLGSVNLSSIPGQLIRRNPATQVLVSKSRLQQSDWRSLGLPGITETHIQLCLWGQWEYYVIAAPMRIKNGLDEELAGIEILREAGLTID